MSSQMGHFLGPDDSSEIEPFDPEALHYRGSTTSGTPSAAAGRKVKQNPVIVSGSGAGTSNGRNGSRSNQKTSPNTPKQKTRDSDCCSINFIKYSLHIFNTMFLISGMVIVGVTLWTVFWKHQYISLLSTTNYVIGTYALLAAGLLAVIGGVLGCCAVCHEHRGILLMYTFILLLVFLLEAIVGGLAYLYETQIEIELQHSLNSTFGEYYGVSESQTQAIDSMQQEFSCCGAVRFEDWRNSVWLRSRRKDLIRPTEGRLVPDSCCITVSPLCGLRDGPSNIHYTGCIYQMTDDVKQHLILLGAIGLGLSVIQIFGMILSCCLYVKLKNVLD
ncbi:CD151 antigen-like [Anopheles ziemanni]|uniref:CD151 antigen-like n=1 Tax=Anopheles coustani TaxID=139045 RepID=UPI00265823AD|nr:CD151 antigen-like [Anopheles coustani]XP_058172947.1 CD151 antigen-like [Anopheles ziemanni]